MKKEKELLVITDEYVQQCAEGNFKRRLTEKELESVEYEFIEGFGLDTFVRDKIEAVLEYDELLSRNADLKEGDPCYELFSKNEIDPSLRDPNLRDRFHTEEDARQYIRTNFKYPGISWRLVYFDGNNKKEIASKP